MCICLPPRPLIRRSFLLCGNWFSGYLSRRVTAGRDSRSLTKSNGINTYIHLRRCKIHQPPGTIAYYLLSRMWDTTRALRCVFCSMVLGGGVLIFLHNFYRCYKEQYKARTPCIIFPTHIERFESLWSGSGVSFGTVKSRLTNGAIRNRDTGDFWWPKFSRGKCACEYACCVCVLY